MKESWIAVLALTFAAGAVGSAAAEKTQPPDLTGIWTQYRGSGPGRTDITSIWPRDPPLTKEAKEKVAEYRALVAPTGDTPGGFCLGAGMPASMLGSGGYPMEIIQRPEQITVIYEAHTEIRRIYMNGRKLAEDELIPSRNGYSTGRWEGDTLVVETIGLKEAIDQTSAHGEEAKIIERYRLTEENGQKVLTVEMTLTDPKFYTRPVTVTKKWAAAGPDVRMMLYECNEPAWEDHLEKLRAARKQESKP